MLKVKEVDLSYIPEPTALFRGILQYRMIYECIKSWFLYGNYELEHEDALVRIVSTSRIYEYYVLMQLINSLKIEGFELIRRKRFIYPAHGINKFDYDVDCYNTFYLKNLTYGCEATLYYQPVIYGTYNENDIGLYRNTSWRLFGEVANSFNTACCYTPDYLLKIEYKNQSYLTNMNVK